MSDLKNRLTEEMKASMKSGDALKLSVIRMVRSAIKNKEIDRGKGTELGDAEVMEVIVSAVKQRNDSIEQFSAGKRDDLVAKEKAEIEILQSFLPKPYTEEEVKALILKAISEAGATGIKDMGKVMKILIPKILGRADSAAASRMVKELLAS
ncbi:MAG: GatB/YqeY domain-containing protein [Nitrospirae bacterium]|nr:GatB/YqeY domain-containing protein [Nitrospirota bacterium]MBI3351424.1 GatB/YqeY domain-containing protein [Nitrospirota bacterium]